MANLTAEKHQVKKEKFKEKKQHADLDKSEFKGKFEVTDEDYSTAIFSEFMTRTRTKVLYLCTFLIAFQFWYALSYLEADYSIAYTIAIVLVILLGFIGTPLFVKARSRKLGNKNDFWLNEQRYTVNNKGFSVLSQHGERRLKWQEIRRVFQTGSSIVLVVYNFHMVVVPTKGLSREEKTNLKKIILRNTQALKTKVKFSKN